MAEFYRQIKGKIVRDDSIVNEITENQIYAYGTGYKKRIDYVSEDIPVCRACGSELRFQKKGKRLVIMSCTNDDCITNIHNYGVHRLHAFLPPELIRKPKERENYRTVEYQMRVHNRTEEEAVAYLKSITDTQREKMTGRTMENFNRESSCLCIEYWLSRGYSEEEGRKNISDIQKTRSAKVKPENRRTVKKGERPDIYFRERSRLCIEYWIKRGYSEDDAIEMISKIQSEISRSKTREQILSSTVRRKEYWLNKGYTEEEAKEKISNLQRTFTLEKCIEKHGEEEGLQIYNNRQKKWLESLHKSKMPQGTSAISQELFFVLLDYYDESEKQDIYFSEHNSECVFKCRDGAFSFDFTDECQKKIIEFNGDVFHGNPKKYSENDHPHPYRKELTASDIWKTDENKIKNITELGYEVLVVWESDYNNEPDLTIIRCLEFLNLV